MKKILFIILLFTLSTIVFSLDLVKDGKSDFVVVVDSKASVAEKYAASEFVKYIEKISNVKLNIVNSPSEKNVYIRTQHKSGNDKVNLKVSNGNLYLEGNNDRGTIYSVYEFLEQFCGVRFFSNDCEKIPSLKDITCPNDLKYSYASPLMGRDCDYVQCGGQYEFSPKLRLNGHCSNGDPKFGGKVGIAENYFCHTVLRFLPTDKYGDAHPDFYAMVKGKRINFGDTQLCMSNKEMRKELAKNVIEGIKNSKQKTMISVSQSDNYIQCECDECKKAIEKYGAFSGLLLETINYVAGEVEKVYPDTYVETLAYHNSLEAPTGIKPAKNVIIRLCDIENNFAEPIEYLSKNAPYKLTNSRMSERIDPQKVNAIYDKTISKWSSITKNLFIWDYVINFTDNHIVHPNLHVLKPNINYFIKHNAKYIFEEADRYNYNASFGELRTYLMAKLMWNPFLDDKALIKEFCEGVYKEGAPEIEEIIDIFTKAITKEPYYMRTYVYDCNWMSNEDMIKSIKLFQSAIEKTKNDALTNDKINLLYVDFLAGWYTKSDEDFEIIKKECNLNWTKDEYYDYLTEFSIEHNNPYYREAVPFSDAARAIQFDRFEKKPKVCEGLQDDEWFEINDEEFYLLTQYGPTIEKDPTTASGKHILLVNNGNWASGLHIPGNVKSDYKAGYSSYDVYAVCKSKDKQNDEGPAMSVGIWDEIPKIQPFLRTVQLKDINDKDWTEVYLGNLQLKNLKEPVLFLEGEINLSVKGVYLDRVVFIKKK